MKKGNDIIKPRKKFKIIKIVGNVMIIDVNKNMKDLGIVLPDAPAPAANYVPFKRCGSMLFISGQISKVGENLITGKLGLNMDIDEGYSAARHCGLALLAQLSLACNGDLNSVTGIIRLGGFVNSTSDFVQHPQVINGASDLMAEVFGDLGHHSRAAVGSSSLPLGVAVEVDGIFEIG
jgi:enamine deaminase RidA (YjgF/YER057c/UK114 family)